MLRRRAWLAAGVAVLALAGCVSGEPSAADGRFGVHRGGAADEVISSADARKVVVDSWKARRAAWRLNDYPAASTALAKVDTGPALAASRNFAMYGVLGRKARTAPAKPDNFADLTSVTVSVPRRQRYPATFLAVTSRPVAGSAPVRLAELFVSWSPGDEWRQLARISVSSAPAVRSADGWAAVAPSSVGRPLTKATDELRRAIGRGFATGKLPSPSVRGAKAVDDVLDGYRSWLTYGENNRLNVRASAADTGAPIPTGPVYATTGGDVLAVVALPIVHDFTGSDVCLVQSADRHQWGYQLAPGRYRAVRASELFLALVTMPAAGGPLTVLGATAPQVGLSADRC